MQSEAVIRMTNFGIVTYQRKAPLAFRSFRCISLDVDEQNGEKEMLRSAEARPLVRPRTSCAPRRVRSEKRDDPGFYEDAGPVRRF